MYKFQLKRPQKNNRVNQKHLSVYLLNEKGTKLNYMVVIFFLVTCLYNHTKVLRGSCFD